MIDDVLTEPGVWRMLMRTLKAGKVEIQGPESALYLLPSALKPEAIPVDVKVILIGEERYYQLLDYYEEEFHKTFKVKAEFDTSIPRTDQHVCDFIAAVDEIARREKFLPLQPGAHAALIEEAVRMAGRRSKLNTRFGEISDIVREAQYWANLEKATEIDRAAVEHALAARRRRHSLYDDKLHDFIEENVLMVDSSGTRVGQINGLAVWGTGPYAFGKPMRITCAVGTGAGGVINIEREARLSGSTHDKAVLILTGFLRQMYGRDRGLSLTASIAFEQTYGGIEGDSATCAEVYALVSAIAEVPLRQDLAITGSMNQLGDVQAIGGVNEKIEGFFRLCQARGLTGTQGCIVPRANVEDLMLSHEVVAAVKEGRFHIYAISRYEEGLELLTGLPLGAPDQEGNYPDGTFNGMIQAGLDTLADDGDGESRIRFEFAPPYHADVPEPPKEPPAPGP